MDINIKNKNLSITVASALAMVLTSTSALAGADQAAETASSGQASDDGTNQVEPSQSDNRQIDRVVVYAQKRPQNLQDVPVAVTAVSGETLSQMGLGNFEDIEVPGVTVSRGGMADLISVRGVGSDANLGFEQSVPIYIDGIYFGRSRTQRVGFMDVGSIEFLKGPQPTHLGKNAVAGAINITSKKPTDELQIELDSLYELNHNEFSTFGAISGPLSEKVRGRLALKHRTLDGWLLNAATGNQNPTQKETMARLNLEFDLSDNFTASVSGYVANTEDKSRNNAVLICGPSGLLTDAIMGAGGYCAPDRESLVLKDIVKASTPVPSLYTDEDVTFFNKTKIAGTSLKLEYDMNDYILSSVTGYYDFENRYFADADHSTLRRLEAHFPEDFNQVSQELRILSPQDADFRWTAGLYYDKNNNDTGSIVTNFIAAMGAGRTIFRDAQEDAESWSAFAEASYDLTETVTATAGGRYSEVRKSIDFDRCFGPLLISTTDTDYSVDPDGIDINSLGCLADRLELGEGHAVAPSRKDTKFQPAVTLEWRPGEDSMFYASWKEGFKAGGFDHGLAPFRSVTNTNINDNFAFEPEEASSFEVGAKLGLFDGSATLNLAAFSTKFTNLQVSVLEDPIALAFSVGNAAQSKTQGFEANFRIAANDYVTLSTGASYLDSKYLSFAGAPCYSGQTAAEGCVGSVQDLSGHTTTFAPDFSATAALDFEYPISDNLNFVSQVSMFYTSKFYTVADFDPNTYQDGYAKVDLRLGVQNVDKGWEVALIVRNLTDKYTSSLISDVPTLGNNKYFGLIDRPRTIALQARIDY